MRLHFEGKYNGDPESLPHGEHRPNAVPFREAKDTRQLSLLANGLAVVLVVLLAVPLILRFRMELLDGYGTLLGCILSLLAFYPHEILHAVCMKEDAYIYSNLKQGMFFVVGPEEMSRARFVFMSLLPNLVFGLLPYALGFLLGSAGLGAFGALCLASGAGDYYNVFNALTQMPKGAKTYLYGFNSYWFLPEEQEEGKKA